MASAVLFSLAYPPFNLWPLMLVALVPMLYQLRTADSKNAWGIGYFFGLFVFLGQMYWLYDLAVHWIGRPFLSLVPWIITAVLEGLFFGWVARLIRHCYLRNWLVLIPVAWAGVEVCRSYFPVVALPWGLAATPLYHLPILIQPAHYGAIFLVSAWGVLFNVVLAEFAAGGKGRSLQIAQGAAGGLLAISVAHYYLPTESDQMRVTAGQPGVDMAFGKGDRLAQIATSVDAITEKAISERSQLLVLPEGIGQDNHFPPKPPFYIDGQLPVLFGGQRGDGPTYQTAFSYDGTWRYADKTRLVIFGEFVPGRSAFPWIAKEFDLPTDDLSASKEGVKTVEVAGIKTGPMLCFEGLFPDISFEHAKNGARLIAVMCIDDWYMGTPAPDQLKASSYFRAVEAGLPLIRSASLGYSIVIDARGNTLGELPLKKPDALTVKMPVPKKASYFPLLPVFPVTSFIFALVLPWIPRKKSA